MLNSLFIHKVRALRFSKTGQNSLGEPTGASHYINGNAYIPARIESYDAQEQYRESNERAVNKTIIYIPPNYQLAVDDEVDRYTDSGWVYIGKVVGVNPGVLGMSTAIDHYEIIIENP